MMQESFLQNCYAKLMIYKHILINTLYFTPVDIRCETNLTEITSIFIVSITFSVIFFNIVAAITTLLIVGSWLYKNPYNSIDVLQRFVVQVDIEKL